MTQCDGVEPEELPPSEAPPDEPLLEDPPDELLPLEDPPDELLLLEDPPDELLLLEELLLEELLLEELLLDGPREPLLLEDALAEPLLLEDALAEPLLLEELLLVRLPDELAPVEEPPEELLLEAPGLPDELLSIPEEELTPLELDCIGEPLELPMLAPELELPPLPVGAPGVLDPHAALSHMSPAPKAGASELRRLDRAKVATWIRAERNACMVTSVFERWLAEPCVRRVSEGFECWPAPGQPHSGSDQSRHDRLTFPHTFTIRRMITAAVRHQLAQSTS
ncbi:MAG: hypothetical protein ABTD50_03225 [Polyangiaceae bacterium]